MSQLVTLSAGRCLVVGTAFFCFLIDYQNNFLTCFSIVISRCIIFSTLKFRFGTILLHWVITNRYVSLRTWLCPLWVFKGGQIWRLICWLGWGLIVCLARIEHLSFPPFRNRELSCISIVMKGKLLSCEEEWSWY